MFVRIQILENERAIQFGGVQRKFDTQKAQNTITME
jgi:hypothetical protein